MQRPQTKHIVSESSSFRSKTLTTSLQWKEHRARTIHLAFEAHLAHVRHHCGIRQIPQSLAGRLLLRLGTSKITQAYYITVLASKGSLSKSQSTSMPSSDATCRAFPMLSPAIRHTFLCFTCNLQARVEDLHWQARQVHLVQVLALNARADIRADINLRTKQPGLGDRQLQSSRRGCSRNAACLFRCPAMPLSRA